jgi:hypothetical protein
MLLKFFVKFQRAYCSLIVLYKIALHRRGASRVSACIQKLATEIDLRLF